MKLIVSGDSNTELNFRSGAHPDWDTSYKKWPEHLAEHLGMELVCLGKGGHGNQYIYHSLLDEIIKTPKEEIGLVVAGWSQAMRKDWQENDNWRNRRVDQDGDLLSWVNKTLRHYMSFQFLCERYDLPYIHFQMGDLFEAYFDGLRPTENLIIGDRDKFIGEYPGLDDDDEKIINRISEYHNIINNFVGYPGLSAQYGYIGGFNMVDKILGENGDIMTERGLIVSEYDQHPNEAGHKAIADFLIKELYEPED